MELIDDTLVWPFMNDLLAELSVEIKTSGLQDPCWLGVLPGAQVALDYCNPCKAGKCGMVWLRLVSIQPFVDPTQPLAPSRCGALFTATYEMGIVRCHQTTDGRGNPMDMAYQAEATRVQLAEMAAMQRVLLCGDAMGHHDVDLGAYSPIGPEGGCVGGAWFATVEMF